MRFIVLDTMKEFSISPVEWDKLDKQTQLEMIEYRNLRVEQEMRIKKKMEEKK